MTSFSPDDAPRAGHAVQREAERNRLLRRADWRFLLPNPHPATSVCLGDGLLRDAVREISGEVLSSATARGACDLVVAIQPDLETLRHACSLLRPGGACYVEYYGRLVRTAMVRQRLHAAGFEQVRTYWPWPWPDRCQAWIPLDDATVASRVLRRGEGAGGGLRARTARSARSVASIARSRLGATGCVGGIAIKPAATRTVRPEGLVAMLRERWAEFALGPRPSRIDIALQTVGRRSISKVVALVYADAQPRPAAVIKIARVQEAVAGLANEAATLDALHHLGGVPPGVPRPLFRNQLSDLFAVGETALPGTPVGVARPISRYERIARAATEWLTQLAAASKSAPGSTRDVSASALRDFAAGYACATGPALIETIRARLALMPPMPRVWEHRDFSPWNVHQAGGGQLSVFDWESSVPRGVPALDLIYFLSYLAADHEQVPLCRASYRDAWSLATAVGRVNRECIARYGRACGIDESAYGGLRLLTWLVHARSEHGRIVADVARSDEAGALRQAVFLGLIEEELRGAIVA